MSEQHVHYETLGLTEASSFEEVQSARKRLVAKYEDDPQQRESIEAAYDAILMERLRLRQEGKIKVPDRIRFAEKQSRPASLSTPNLSSPENSGPQWLADLLDQPESSRDLLWPSAIFAGLIGLSWLMSSGDGVGASTALALGMMCAIYFLNKKSRKLWRSLGIAAAGVAVGFGIGLAVTQLLSAQGTALPGRQEISLLASAALACLWFVTGFLR